MFIRARAPLRISFVGGGTDLASYYNEHGGAVLSSTINRYTLVTLSTRQDDGIQICSLDFDLTVKYHINEEPAYDGVLDLAKAAIRRIQGLNGPQGLDLDIQSGAPAGSGLGGSASLTLAVVGTLLDYKGDKLDNYHLAELAYAIERDDLKISGGKQDQYEIAFGGFNLIEFSKDKIVVNPLRLDRDILNDLEQHLMLCYTGKTRFSAGIIDKQEAFYREGRQDTLAGLSEIHRLVYEIKDALLTGHLYDFARMLDAAWASKIKLNPLITDDNINEMYEVARRNGVIGGKLLGAGGGGYLLLFCEIGKRRQVREALEKMGGQFTEFSFTQDGLQVWRSTCP
jgi:D-glycero-alpha-D-manno-heptose-7-phosphate kinase